MRPKTELNFRDRGSCPDAHGESCGNVLPDIHFDNSDADAEVVYTAESGNVQYVDDD